MCSLNKEGGGGGCGGDRSPAKPTPSILYLRFYEEVFNSIQFLNLILPSDDQAIYCNKLTRTGGGGGSFRTTIDFPNSCT